MINIPEKNKKKEQGRNLLLNQAREVHIQYKCPTITATPDTGKFSHFHLSYTTRIPDLIVNWRIYNM